MHRHYGNTRMLWKPSYGSSLKITFSSLVRLYVHKIQIFTSNVVPYFMKGELCRSTQRFKVKKNKKDISLNICAGVIIVFHLTLLKTSQPLSLCVCVCLFVLILLILQLSCAFQPDSQGRFLIHIWKLENELECYSPSNFSL